MNLVGDSSVPQRAYLLYTGVDSVAIADFEVYYTPGFSIPSIGDWTFCSEPTFDGTRPPWPVGDSVASARWVTKPLTATPNGIVVLGAIDLAAGATGEFHAWETPKFALAYTHGGDLHVINVDAVAFFGRVSVDGATLDLINNPCEVVVPARPTSWTGIKALYR